MFEPPSQDLIRNLEQFTATQKRDLSRCRAYVRLLSRDLPTFDSIWLDALVQQRSLTPFQADHLAQGNEEALKVGDYLLLNEIHREPVHVRYMAQHVQTRRRFLVDEYRQQTPVTSETLANLSLLSNQIEQSGQPAGSLVIPSDYISRDQSLFVVQSAVHGLTARELLIRRGRFPEILVKIITAKLLEQLGILEASGVIHGDVRISNLILSRKGSVTLLNAGVVPQLSPHWTLHVPLSYESYDCFAPEMIRNGSWTTQTDLYSAGCLLWQLACGRSPVHSMDSLLKLRSHASRSIPDVREFAPETDSYTAEIIYRLTRRELNERPDSAQSLLADQKQNWSSGGLIRNYVKEFDRPVSGPTRISPRMTLVTTACLMFCILFWGVSRQMASPGMNQLILSILGRTPGGVQVPDNSRQSAANSQWEHAMPLPAPDSHGVMKLVAGQKYRAKDLSTVGPLQIVSTSLESQESEISKENRSVNATLLVSGQPWRIQATHVSLRNITLEYQEAESSSAEQAESTSLPAALLVCQSLTFEADQCQFRAIEKAGQRTRSLAWKPLSSTEVNAGRLDVSNCQFYSPGTGIMIGGPSRRIQIHNCLKVGPGDFLEFSQRNSGIRFPEIQCEQLTLRQADSLLSIHFDDPGRKTQVELTIDATNCVFDLSPASPALLRLSSTEIPLGQIHRIDLLGQILLLNPGANLFGWWNPESRKIQSFKVPGSVEGIFAYELQFRGDDLTELKSSELIDYQGTRWNSVSPGIDVSRFDQREAASAVSNTKAKRQ